MLNCFLLYELWPGERLVLEKALPRYRRPHRPISVSAVPFGLGIDIWRSCRFIGALMRSLRALPGGIGRLVPCMIGANHCRSRHIGGRSVVMGLLPVPERLLSWPFMVGPLQIPFLGLLLHFWQVLCHCGVVSVAILAQVGIQAPGLSFRRICHLGKTRFESGFVCCVHRMAPVACRPIIKCGKSGCTGSCPLSVVEYGFTAGKMPATCRTCGKTFPRPNVTRSDFLPAESERKKRNRSPNSSPGMSRRSRNVSPAMSRKSSVVSWCDSPREQSGVNGEDAVMEDGTATHQAEINKQIKANDKLRKISRTCQRNTGRLSKVTVSIRK